MPYDLTDETWLASDDAELLQDDGAALSNPDNWLNAGDPEPLDPKLTVAPKGSAKPAQTNGLFAWIASFRRDCTYSSSLTIELHPVVRAVDLVDFGNPPDRHYGVKCEQRDPFPRPRPRGYLREAGVRPDPHEAYSPRDDAPERVALSKRMWPVYRLPRPRFGNRGFTPDELAAIAAVMGEYLNKKLPDPEDNPEELAAALAALGPRVQKLPKGRRPRSDGPMGPRYRTPAGKFEEPLSPLLTEPSDPDGLRSPDDEDLGDPFEPAVPADAPLLAADTLLSASGRMAGNEPAEGDGTDYARSDDGPALYGLLPSRRIPPARGRRGAGAWPRMPGMPKRNPGGEPETLAMVAEARQIIRTGINFACGSFTELPRCLVCNSWFIAERGDARTCSDKCRKALSRARKKDHVTDRQKNMRGNPPLSRPARHKSALYMRAVFKRSCGPPD